MELSGEQELPFLEIDPPERLFEFILDETLCGKSFASVLFNRPVRIEFGSSADHGGPPWVKITSSDPNCAEIEIGIELECDGMSCGGTYFSSGMISCVSDDDCWFGLDSDALSQAILTRLRYTMEYGYIELWKGNADPSSRGFGGPVRSDDRSPGWLKRWIKDEERTRDQEAAQGKKGHWYEVIPSILFHIVFSPILILLILIKITRSPRRVRRFRACRYPPSPFD